jgi:hypothetical protein
MNQPAKAAHSVRLYTRVTPALYALLQQVRVARQIEDDAALLREALRRYLDEQAEQVGSKRHFSATFQRRINRLDWHLTVPDLSDRPGLWTADCPCHPAEGAGRSLD